MRSHRRVLAWSPKSGAGESGQPHPHHNHSEAAYCSTLPGSHCRRPLNSPPAQLHRRLRKREHPRTTYVLWTLFQLFQQRQAMVPEIIAVKGPSVLLPERQQSETAVQRSLLSPTVDSPTTLRWEPSFPRPRALIPNPPPTLSTDSYIEGSADVSI